MLENDRLKPYLLQIDLENMILAAKNIKMISLIGIISEFRTGSRFMPARPCDRVSPGVRLGRAAVGSLGPSGLDELPQQRGLVLGGVRERYGEQEDREESAGRDLAPRHRDWSVSRKSIPRPPCLLRMQRSLGVYTTVAWSSPDQLELWVCLIGFSGRRMA